MDNGQLSRDGDDDGLALRAAHATLYQHGANQSSTSVLENVEMARDELFAGPVAESLPSSVSAFPHHRGRADSTASFAYYDEVADQDADLIASGTRLHLQERQDLGDSSADLALLGLAITDSDDEESADDHHLASDDDHVLRRTSSTRSRSSVHAHLLRRDSNTTTASFRSDGRTSQKLYMKNEDLTIVIAGFNTSRWGFLFYILSCCLSFGLAFLLFRWLPRLYIGILGQSCPLRDCEWVVIENQWGEMAIQKINVQMFGRPISSIFGRLEKAFSYGLDGDTDPLIGDLRTIDYRYVKLCFHPFKDKFVLSNGWKDPEWKSVRAVRSGLDNDEKTGRDLIFGKNLIDIEQKSMGQLLVDEVLHPFYIFQVASLTLWCLDDYYYYAACIFVMSVGSIVATLIETRSTMRRLRKLSRFECDIRVLRNGFWRNIPSADLVPGDIYEISDPSLTQFPCDSLLLTGDCIVNESMLTGESVPVSKLPGTDEIMQNMDLGASTISPEIARHFLFCGTKIIRVRRPQDDQDGDAVSLALVVRTGFNTTKGALVRSMLFPKPSGFKFYRDSFRYISVMAFMAVLGFVASLINFLRLQLAWHFIIIRALDLITIVVPPALPATLTIGTNFALARLSKKKIFCISPQRVNVGGKLDIMCFDKTGTLTEDGLDVLGVRVASAGSKYFGALISKPQALEQANTGQSSQKRTLQAALYTMATCHNLRSVDGDLVGDPLDLKMFEFTQWLFKEGKQSAADGEDEEQGGLSPSIAYPPDASQQLGILKSFEFVSQLRRASVIVRHFGQRSGDIYVKGAPEAMREICCPESLPEDYDELLSHYTHKGYRVIGCATRHLNHLTWVKAQKMIRSEVEQNLDFIGFIIFENKLKPSTADVLRELKESNIGTVMVTGDNILTAISVARECRLLDPYAPCFVPRFARGANNDPTAELQWESIDNPSYCLDRLSLKPLSVPPPGDISLPYDILNMRNYSLAVSGEVFRWIVDYAPVDILRKVLVKGKVFARMSPDEKHELVERLQSIDYCCGFCGDGANDCGALKAADVGISLSDAEASVAAPFTCQVFDICCVLQVIREGRAALVTSFSCFKYMSLYSAIQFTTVSFLYAKASNLGDSQFLFIDVSLILPLAIFMGWAGPAEKLHTKHPTANLISRKVLTPLLGLVALCVAIQAIAYFTVGEQPWYMPPNYDDKEPNIKNSENTALFLISCLQYIFSGVILNAGPPFRHPITRNWPFIATLFLTLATSLYMIIGPSRSVKHLMELSYMHWDYKLFLVLLGLVYLMVGWVFEKHVAVGLAKFLGTADQKLGGKVKKRKEYKLIEEGMRL